MRKIRYISIWVMICLVLVMISGCKKENGTTVKGEQGTNIKQQESKNMPKQLKDPNITVLTWENLDDERSIQPSNIFKEKYKGTINYIQTPFGELPTKLTALVSAGDAPDVSMVSPDFMPNCAIKNLLQPVDSYIDIKDPVLDLFLMDQLKYKNKYYLVCSAPGARLLFFNQDMFDNNGVKTPLEHYKEGTWNWQTMRDIAKQFTRDTNGDGVIDQNGLSYNPTARPIFMIMNGTDFVEYTNDGIKLTVNNPKMMEALQFVQDLHFIDNSVGGNQDFFNGKSAMYIGSTDLPSPGNKLDGFKYKWGIAPFPAGPSVPTDISHGGAGGAMGIPTGAKNPEGGAAFIYTRMKYNRETKIDSYAKIYNNEQIKLIQDLEKQITLVKYNGIASMSKVFHALWVEITKKGTPIATAVDKYTPEFQREIDLVLEGN